MRFHNLTKVACLLAVAALSTGSVSAAGPAPECTCAKQADWSFPSEASQLLKDIRTASYQVTDNAERLQSFAYSKVSWQSHASELTLVREQVNEIGAKIERLRSIKHAIEPWQQEALDSVTKAGVRLAAGTEAAIRHLNDNRNFLWSDTYRGHLTTLSTGADQMKQSVGLHLELADTQEKLELLRQQAAGLGS